MTSRIRNIAHAMAEARPRCRFTQPCSYRYSPSVWNWCSEPPVAPAPPLNSKGSPNSWVAPIVETTHVKRIVGRSEGTVTWRNCCQRDAPSSAADSYSSPGTACIAAR